MQVCRKLGDVCLQFRNSKEKKKMKRRNNFYALRLVGWVLVAGVFNDVLVFHFRFRLFNNIYCTSFFATLL